LGKRLAHHLPLQKRLQERALLALLAGLALLSTVHNTSSYCLLALRSMNCLTFEHG
jgi:hypothetical protein